jgi:3-deoxy-D-manno-octulosonate 8-phosphate phosphatase (KDO 8-P phosphatase)
MSGETINKMLHHSIFNNITTFIFDVDGVLTDGAILITEDGSLLRTMNVKDGLALKIALDSGYNICIITKGTSLGVRKRLELLGIRDIYDNLKEKQAAFQEYTLKYGLDKSELLYMGDDLPDLAIKDKVALFCCPNDAAPDVIKASDFISPIKGGRGCVRNIIERVMRIQDKWKG